MTGGDGLTLEAVWDGQTLALLLIAAGIGAVAGLGRLARFPIDKVPRFSAIIGTLVTGAIAAVGAFYVFAPSTSLKFISDCALAGYIGPALLDALDLRFKLLAAEDRATKALAVAEQAVVKAEEALDIASAPRTGSARVEPTELEALQADIKVVRAALEAIKGNGRA